MVALSDGNPMAFREVYQVSGYELEHGPAGETASGRRAVVLDHCWLVYLAYPNQALL
jgi:hypothetical protein